MLTIVLNILHQLCFFSIRKRHMNFKINPENKIHNYINFVIIPIIPFRQVILIVHCSHASYYVRIYEMMLLPYRRKNNFSMDLLPSIFFLVRSFFSNGIRYFAVAMKTSVAIFMQILKIICICKNIHVC